MVRETKGRDWNAGGGAETTMGGTWRGPKRLGRSQSLTGGIKLTKVETLPAELPLRWSDRKCVMLHDLTRTLSQHHEPECPSGVLGS